MASKHRQLKPALSLDPGDNVSVLQPPRNTAPKAKNRSSAEQEDREQIEAAVADLLDREGTDDERRGEPRLRFVRRGHVRWEEAAGDVTGNHVARPLPPAFLLGCEVVTIDISARGVGIITWQKIPKRDLVFELPGVRFLCKPLWEKAIGSETWQYGILFTKVLEPLQRTRTGVPCEA